MIEVVVHGRGGRGGVTLAKLIAGAYFIRGSYVQAFGVYGAERSGAPVQAYVRVDDDEIVTHAPIVTPDHVVVIDPSLITPAVAAGLKPSGWMILNTPQPPEDLADVFPGRQVATVDANAIAVENRLGSTALPIVNTTMLGAVCRLLGLGFEDIRAALEQAGFGGGNVDAARAAVEHVRTAELPGAVVPITPSVPPATPDFTEVGVGELPPTHTGEWASRQPHARELDAVCSDSCPAGNDVRGFLQAAAHGDYDAALSTVLRTSPFPGVCGRVCPAPCMAACNRTAVDEAVNVREVERAIAERGVWPEPTAPGRHERVAVIGSGPAGLAAAYHLARAGYPVTVYEAGPEIGGVLRTGIPAYRLPREVLDREIGYIARHGVEMVTDHPVDRDEFARIAGDCSAVFVATGLQHLPSLDLGDACDDGIVQGLEFLDRARRGEASLADESVVVVGGGNTAMDAARTALRLGARDVRIAYRRTRSEMPAIAEEIDEALEEGVVLDELVAPIRLRDQRNGRVLACRRMRLGEPDESGRRRPVPVSGDEAVVEFACDRLLLALGQSPDLSVLPAGAEIKDCRVCGGVGDSLVLAGGDLVTGAGTVTAAVGSGRAAAARIHAQLCGEALGSPEAHETAGPEVMALRSFPKLPQHKGRTLPIRERKCGFGEVHLGLAAGSEEDEIAEEAARCLSCGACNECQTCIAFCPEGVVGPDGTRRYGFDYEYCKGCGLCAAQCPRGAIVMVNCGEEVAR